jgi:hypothetical protein
MTVCIVVLVSHAALQSCLSSNTPQAAQRMRTAGALSPFALCVLRLSDQTKSVRRSYDVSPVSCIPTDAFWSPRLASARRPAWSINSKWMSS